MLLFLPAGCHGNLPVLNLLSASVAKNQHFRPWIKNCALDRKTIDTFRICDYVLYLDAKIGGDTTRAGCRSENWCVFLYFTLGVRERWDIVQRSIVYGLILMRFSAVFSELIVLSHFCCWVAPQWLRNRGQKLRKVQKSTDKFVRTISCR